MLPDQLRVLYLHGFASSPGSRKARFFTEKLSAAGVRVEVPALDDGDFRNLTITGQLQVVARVAGDAPVVLIGSSLGGYIAGLYAARHANVERLVLLAPAFQFHHLWTARLTPDELRVWKRDGTLPIFHYGEARDVPIGYQLLEDAARYERWPNFLQPALIFHGTLDQDVPVAYSVEFVRNHPKSRLIQLNSGHELTNVLDQIWEQSRDFLLDANR
jgi:pimeloyl-ACP methyl ester carboxylesterase